MRLKTFHAKSLQDAMLLVREQLGDRAIIVDTYDSGGPQGARVTAAIDQKDDPYELEQENSADLLDVITDALESHGAPPDLTDRLVNEASMVETSDAEEALAYALGEVFQFDPLPSNLDARPLILIGPPGTGKTVSCAKLAARAALETLASGQTQPAHTAIENTAPVSLIAADTVRLGAVEQLSLYAERLGARLFVASDAQALEAALAQCRKGELVVIDTPGVNPYKLEDIAAIVELTEAMPMDPVLVLTAGRDAEEAADLAKAFRPIGPSRLLITGFDIARRLGSMLAAAEASDLALSDIGRSPAIADGFEPLDPMKLARLILPHNDNRDPV